MGGSSAPSVQAATVPPPIPTVQTPAQIKAATSTQQRAQAAVGPSATIRTGPNGLVDAQGVVQQATTGAKTLLGS